MVPYQPPMEGPGLTGAPEHVAFGFDGTVPPFLSSMDAHLRVFPVAQYEAMYAEQGNSAISDYITALKAQLEGGSDEDDEGSVSEEDLLDWRAKGV